MRASEPSDGSRKKNPSLYRLTAGRAKEWGGKYALCHKAGDALIAIGPLYDTLDEANTAWQEKSDTRVVVGCCNRLDRRWQIPRFNPLYAVFDPRPKPGSEARETEPKVQSKASPCPDTAEEDDDPPARYIGDDDEEDDL